MNDTIQVLVIDDKIFLRELMEKVLKRNGYTVQTASDGKEGIKLFNKLKNIRVVITDIDMPLMNGYEVDKYIRASKRSGTPIIAMTGGEVPNGIMDGLFDHVLLKPFSVKSLSNLVGSYL